MVMRVLEIELWGYQEYKECSEVLVIKIKLTKYEVLRGYQ
jgi:hypothetical protein